MSKFVISYFNKLSDYYLRLKNNNYVLEGCYLNIEDVLELAVPRKTIFIILLYNELSVQDIYDNLRKYDEPADFTYIYDDKELMEYAKNLYMNNKYIYEAVKKYDLPYFDVLEDRSETLEEIIKFLEKEIKAKSKIIDANQE